MWFSTGKDYMPKRGLESCITGQRRKGFNYQVNIKVQKKENEDNYLMWEQMQ
jgi:hypothetical protein